MQQSENNQVQHYKMQANRLLRSLNVALARIEFRDQIINKLIYYIEKCKAKKKKLRLNKKNKANVKRKRRN